METIEITIDPRDARSKGGARALRRAGKVPAILYGPKRQPTPVALDAKEFLTKVTALEGSHLLRLRSPCQELAGGLALVKDTQRDPVSGNVIHADLYEVDVNAKLRVRVPLHFVGRAAGVEAGGILQPIQREVEVLCLPTDIPEYIEVDVTPLGIHDSVHISELRAPAGVEVQFDSDEPVVSVLPPTVEEVKVAAEAAEAAPAEEAAAAAPAKPEAAKGGA